MKILLLILHLLPYVPVIATRPPVVALPAPTGAGTLLIAGCRPGDAIGVEPGHLSGVAGKDGVVRIQAPAQNEQSEPYRIYAAGASFDLNGTLSANESLSGVCP